MRQSIEKRQEIQAAKSRLTVIFPDSSVIWGCFDSRRRGSRSAWSLSVAVKPCAYSAPAPASLSGLLTEAHETSGYIGKAVSQSLPHQKKFSTEARLALSALPAFERAPNSDRDTAVCNLTTSKSEQRCCFAA